MTAGRLDMLRWPEGDGLLPAIVQDAATGEVRMLGWMNREALAATLESGRVTFWSRSRAALWVKGETSGHTLALRAISTDCDGDALLVAAVPDGPTCHAGTPSCFGPAASPPLLALERTIADRLSRGAAAETESYTARLAAEGIARVAQKVGEEAVEAALAAATGDDEGLVAESADLVYHLALLLALRKRSLADVAAELARRAAKGGGRDRRTAQTPSGLPARSPI